MPVQVLQPHRPGQSGSPPRYTGLGSALISIARTEGIRGLYKVESKCPHSSLGAIRYRSPFSNGWRAAMLRFGLGAKCRKGWVHV